MTIKIPAKWHEFPNRVIHWPGFYSSPVLNSKSNQLTNRPTDPPTNKVHGAESLLTS